MSVPVSILCDYYDKQHSVYYTAVGSIVTAFIAYCLSFTEWHDLIMNNIICAILNSEAFECPFRNPWVAITITILLYIYHMYHKMWWLD